MGIEYCPPSQYLLPVLETDSGKQNTDCLDGMEEAWKVEYVTHTELKSTLESIYCAFFLFLFWFDLVCVALLLQNKFCDYEKRKVSFIFSCKLRS